MKKGIKIFTIIVGIVIIFLFLIYQSNVKKDDNILTIGYSGQSLNYGPLMVANDGDFFKKHELQVKIVPFSSGSHTRLALSTGRVNVALLNISDLLITIDAGAPIKILAPVAKASTVVFVRPDNQIQKFSDLKGKKIYGETGASRLEFIRAAKKEGLKDSDFTFVNIDKDYREIALLQQKAIDALPTSRYKEESFIKAGAILLPEWETKGYGGQFNPHTYIAVNTDYAKNHQREIEKIISAIVDSQGFIKENPERAAEIIATHIQNVAGGVRKFSTKQILESWKNSIQYVVWIDRKEVDEIIDFLFTAKEIKNRLLYNQISYPQFDEVLKTKQRELYEQKN